MRVAIITGRDPAHKYLCTRIAEQFEVTGILHPAPSRRSATGRLRSITAGLRKHGATHVFLQKLNSIPLFSPGWDRQGSLNRAQKRFFSEAAAEYEKKVSHLARNVADINSAESVSMVADLRADVVICLGGPIYRAPLIKAVPLMLNYHTGISPIYNGNGTIYWTFANGHVHLAGGTLMVMSEVVDGGVILAHYLCPVEAEDDPGTLFAKAIVGGTKLYTRFLQHLDRGETYMGVRQPKPFFNYRGFEWTVYQALAVKRNIGRKICHRRQRPEQIIEYWPLESEQAARLALRGNIARWVCGE